MSEKISAQYKKSRREIDDSNNRGVSINDLPEDVIIQIMSRLPMEDAVRTSVMSKDWKHKWASVSRINIADWRSCKSFALWERKHASFTNYVDKILLHSLNIQSFRLSCLYMRDPTLLTTWISTIARRRVPNIEITSFTPAGFILPLCLLDNTALTSLKLTLPCIMKVPVKDYLCNLKFLFLFKVQFQNECFSSADRLQLTFPVLESLELESCTWGSMKFVMINSTALTTFNYNSCEPHHNDFLIKICGSKLEKFQISGALLNNLDLRASSIAYATIGDFSRRYEHPFIGVSESHSRISIKEFSSLKYLRLHGPITKAYAQLKPGVSLPRFDKLQRLKMSYCFVPEAFLELLHMAPNLKQLVFDGVGLEALQKDLDSKGFNFDDVGLVPYCLLSHLAEIEFYYFRGAKGELHLVKLLLNNSPKLEKLIFFKPLIQKADVEKWVSLYLKCSNDISVVFRYFT